MALRYDKHRTSPDGKYEYIHYNTVNGKGHYTFKLYGGDFHNVKELALTRGWESGTVIRSIRGFNALRNKAEENIIKKQAKAVDSAQLSLFNKGE